MVSSNIPIQIKGGNPLQGRVRIQGSKNASLPVLAATLLIAGQCTLDNCPQIMDVVCMQKLLEHAGCQVKKDRPPYDSECRACKRTPAAGRICRQNAFISDSYGRTAWKESVR